MPSSVQRARGLFNSFEKRRRDCSVRLMLVVRLCSCSAAKGAEYFSTARYSWPCTSSFSEQPGVLAVAEKLLVHGQEYLAVLKYSAPFVAEKLLVHGKEYLAVLKYSAPFGCAVARRQKAPNTSAPRDIPGHAPAASRPRPAHPAVPRCTAAALRWRARATPPALDSTAGQKSIPPPPLAVARCCPVRPCPCRRPA